MPVMVCVEISDTEEHEQVTKVVAGTEPGDIQLARDRDGHSLIYDEHMERVNADELVSARPSPQPTNATPGRHVATGRKAPMRSGIRGCTKTATSTKAMTKVSTCPPAPQHAPRALVAP
jgi:hypothetical protein